MCCFKGFVATPSHQMIYNSEIFKHWRHILVQKGTAHSELCTILIQCTLPIHIVKPFNWLLCENILQEVTILPTMDFVQKKKKNQPKQNVLLATQVKIYCTGSPNQLLPCMKKTKRIHTKKARCKIFTNRYKNINMNKLISSTFLYCPLSTLFSFQQMEKETWQT